jgi:ankyrin repeat protein
VSSPPSEGEKNRFHQAARSGDLGGLRVFLEMYGRSYVDVHELLSDSPALLEAAAAGRASAVELLLNHGADIEAGDREYRIRPLMAAADKGREDCVRLLVKRGADLEARDRMGETALMREASRGHTHMVAVLLDLGADIHAGADVGATPLHKAVCMRKPETVALLLARGARAEVDLPDRFGQTPLMWAADCGLADVAKVLLDGGADASVRDPRGKTAADFARDRRHDALARSLSEALATPGVRAQAQARLRQRASGGPKLRPPRP